MSAAMKHVADVSCVFSKIMNQCIEQARRLSQIAAAQLHFS